jgi:hypothetical protein
MGAVSAGTEQDLYSPFSPAAQLFGTTCGFCS